MPRIRKTRDCWRFFVNYGHGWEHEITEYTREEMKVNRKAYHENCAYPLRVVFGRERIDPACVTSMGCLCAGHARGNHPLAQCDTRESVAASRV